MNARHCSVLPGTIGKTTAIIGIGTSSGTSAPPTVGRTGCLPSWRRVCAGPVASGTVVGMQDDTTPKTAGQSPKPEPTARYSEAELSRIAREAVHQAPDARLDRELARLGLVD